MNTTNSVTAIKNSETQRVPTKDRDIVYILSRICPSQIGNAWSWVGRDYSIAELREDLERLLLSSCEESKSC
jgi:hypothetical protein